MNLAQSIYRLVQNARVNNEDHPNPTSLSGHAIAFNANEQRIIQGLLGKSHSWTTAVAGEVNVAKSDESMLGIWW